MKMEGTVGGCKHPGKKLEQVRGLIYPCFGSFRIRFEFPLICFGIVIPGKCNFVGKDSVGAWASE